MIQRLAIDLDRPDATYRAGERIEGALILEADAPVRLRDLAVSVAWRTARSGNADGGESAPLRLGAHEVSPREPLRVPFAIDAPLGPVSYTGRLFSIESAVAAVGFGEDGELLEFQLRPITLLPAIATDLSPSRAGYRDRPVAVATPHDLGPAHGKAVAKRPVDGMAAGSGAACAALGLYELLHALPPHGAILHAALGALFLAGGAKLTATALRRPLTASKLGAPELTVSPSTATRGDRVTARLVLCPTAELTVQKIWLELAGAEEAAFGQGEYRRVVTHDLFRERRVVLEERALAPGAPHAFEVAFDLPEDAPPTFEATESRLVWRVVAGVELTGYGGLREERALTVQPR